MTHERDVRESERVSLLGVEIASRSIRLNLDPNLSHEERLTIRNEQLNFVAELVNERAWVYLAQVFNGLCGQDTIRNIVGTLQRARLGNTGIAASEQFYVTTNIDPHVLMVLRERPITIVGCLIGGEHSFFYAIQPTDDVALRVFVVGPRGCSRAEALTWDDQGKLTADDALTGRTFSERLNRWFENATRLAHSSPATLFENEDAEWLGMFLSRPLRHLLSDATGARELVWIPHGRLWSFPMALVRCADDRVFGQLGPITAASLYAETTPVAYGATPQSRGSPKVFLSVDSMMLAKESQLLRALLEPLLTSTIDEAGAIIMFGHGFGAPGSLYTGSHGWSMARLIHEGQRRPLDLIILASCFGGASVQMGAWSDHDGMDACLGALGAYSVISAPWPMPVPFALLMTSLMILMWWSGVPPIGFASVAGRATVAWPDGGFESYVFSKIKESGIRLDEGQERALTHILELWRQSLPQDPLKRTAIEKGISRLCWPNLRVSRTWDASMIIPHEIIDKLNSGVMPEPGQVFAGPLGRIVVNSTTDESKD